MTKKTVNAGSPAGGHEYETEVVSFFKGGEVVTLRRLNGDPNQRVILVLATPRADEHLPEHEQHDCDAMGCGQDHVVYRSAFVDVPRRPRQPLADDRANLIDELGQAHWSLAEREDTLRSIRRFLNIHPGEEGAGLTNAVLRAFAVLQDRIVALEQRAVLAEQTAADRLITQLDADGQIRAREPKVVLAEMRNQLAAALQRPVPAPHPAFLDEVARRFAIAALETWLPDPHEFSTRPCPTCRAISALIGPWGCIALAAERTKEATDGR